MQIIRTPDHFDQINSKVEIATRIMLPAYMMVVLGEKAKASGLELRQDYFVHLGRHLSKAVEGLDQISEARAAKLVAERAKELLTAVSTDHAITVLYVVMYSIFKAVEEGAITDVTSQPVLYSTLLIHESEDMGFPWAINKNWVKQKAGEMFSTCYYKNWY